MYWIAVTYAWCDGFCFALQWYFCGFNFESHFKDACIELAEGDDENGLNSVEKDELKDFEKFKENFMKLKFKDEDDKVVEEMDIISPIKRPMPFGLAVLSPIIKTCDCAYRILTTFYSPRCFGRKPAVKYKLSHKNMINAHQVAQIVLHSDMFIPNETFNRFPFTIWPFKDTYQYYYIELALALQKIIDSEEAFYLKHICKENFDSTDPNQISRIGNLIMRRRRGELATGSKT